MTRDELRRNRRYYRTWPGDIRLQVRLELRVRAATDALAALARRLDHWAAVVDVQTFDSQVGIGRGILVPVARRL